MSLSREAAAFAGLVEGSCVHGICRFRARAKPRIDGRLSQKPRDVVWDALGDGAVACSLDGAFGQNIPQRDAVLVQKGRFVLDRFGCGGVEQSCHHFPEAVLRMPVVKADFP